MLRELVDILLSELPGSSCTPVFCTGTSLGAQSSAYLYIGVFTRCEEGEVDLTSSTGDIAPAAPGLVQTFALAAGAQFDFIGYRISTPNPF